MTANRFCSEPSVACGEGTRGRRAPRWLPLSAMTGLNAITFHTDDMASACAFWTAAGLSYAYGGPTSSFTSLRAGGGTFVNLQLVDTYGSARSWGRIIIHVDSPDDVHAALTAAGYAPHADPADAPWGERYFHVNDPEGNEISFARPI